VERGLQRWLSTRSAPAATALAIGIALIWLAQLAAGGTSHVPPHAFYFPILFAAVRFGHTGAAVSAVAAAVLAGPLLPADVLTGEAQRTSDWLVRAVFFVAIGQTLTVLGRSLVTEQRDQLARLDNRRDLMEAIDRGELRLLYQPIVDLRGRVVGVEALVRWHHPRYGTMTPDQFIPFAEESGLIAPLDSWVLRSACEHTARWRDDVLADVESFRIAINVSAHELAGHELRDRVDDALAATGLPPSWLHLEITETALVDDLETSALQLEALKQCGVQLAIDDFGVGYGSLTYLERFPVDVVKVDRSFIAAIDRPATEPPVAGAIIELTKRRGLCAVAEGVETERQAAALVSLGCRYAQGWYFGAPATPSTIEDVLRGQRAVDEAPATQTRRRRRGEGGDPSPSTFAVRERLSG
jgi:EAL domain-containing protein (putative c-di-GMP-specific phosphodiesterase class I)